MIRIADKAECCGCAACANVCPRNCIEMAFDLEGCEYPRVDVSRCVECGLCERVCPVTNGQTEIPLQQWAYLVQHTDKKVLSESTSGGAFSALAQGVISRGGVVFGHGFDGYEYEGVPVVSCLSVEREIDLSQFRNSKYVQSWVGDSMQRVKRELACGRDVLFSGTPCMCEGLLNYLGSHPNNLLLVDFVCRAVPCRLVYKSYFGWLESRLGRPVSTIRFRDKRNFGYRYSNICAFESDDDKPLYCSGVESDPFLRAFFGDVCDRPSCYVCRFKKRYRRTDLTLWDCFEVSRYSRELDDNRGVTRVLAHSERGHKAIEGILSRARVIEITPDDAVEGMLQMVAPVALNTKRAMFMSDVERMPPVEVFSKWFPDTPRVVVERLSRRVLARFGLYDRVKKIAKRALAFRAISASSKGKEK